MKVSLNVIKRFVDFELPPVGELVERINMQLGGVEEVTDLAPKYKDVVIVKVVSCEKHPNADRLSVCMIDDGGVVKDVERDKNGCVQVVCGAPNAREGIFAAWLPPKSTVPASYGDADPFVLDTRDIRGVKSNGMLAAADELALGSDHTGIIEITETDLPPELVIKEIKAGLSFAEIFGLDDVIIDIENKMFTHRPDCFGQLGVAREISAILKGVPSPQEPIEDTRFVNPDWYWLHPAFKDGSGLDLKVFNDVPTKSPRFMAVAMSDVEVKPSPLWLQIELIRLGSKAINNIVDATNYIMLLTAQPTHAYDYDKLHGKTLGVRMAKKGESATFLNGKTYILSEDDVVIADGEGVIGLAGIIGGGNSEVSADTKNIVLEVANFDMYTLRKSSMRYGIFTDALTRFSKGQSRLQNDRVLDRLMQMFSELGGAKQASKVFDLPDKSGQPIDDSLSGEIPISASFINERLGTQLEVWQIGGLLRRANFASYPMDGDETALLVTAPFWRTDIELPEDIVEEVGRLYGFDKLPCKLPHKSIKPAAKNKKIEAKRLIREKLSSSGANEVLTYSFVHEKVIRRAEQDSTLAFRLGNAISPDLQFYRLSLTASLLDKIHANIKAGHDEFALFEIGKSHCIGDNDDEGLPNESERVAFVYSAKKSNETPYFVTRRYVDVLCAGLEYTPLENFDLDGDKVLEQLTAPFDPRRSAVLTYDGAFVGVVGEYKTTVRKAFKLPDATAGFEILVSYFLDKAPKTYIPLSRFPSVTQDISLRVKSDLPQQDLFKVAQDACTSALPENTSANLETIDIYQAEGSDQKTITLRLKVASYERTLTDAEVTSYLDAIAKAAGKAIGAVQI